MGQILELTEIENKSRRLEQKSGREPSKARFPGPTNLSFRNNVKNKKLNVGIERWYNKYMELYNAVVTAEVAAAEQKVRDSIMNEKQNAEESTNEKVIAEDNAIAKITSYDVAKSRFEKLKIENEKIKNRFGNLGNNYGVNVKEKFGAKALSVPSLYKRIYKTILGKADMYKMKNGVQEKNGQVEAKSAVANWRSLFDGVAARTNEVVVALDSHEDEQEEIVVENNRKLTEEELSRRILQGRAGDELAEIRRLKKDTNGIASPFSNGLLERERSVLKILANSTGIESIANKVAQTEQVNSNTEFQDLIEKIVGYKEPITEEEHEEQEREMQDYYSDPDVSKTIDDLRHKDILYAYNQPEFYNKIQEAERIDNQKIAENSKAIDVIDNEENQNDDPYGRMLELNLSRRAEEKSAVPENSARTQQDDDLEMIRESAPKQAEILQEKYENSKTMEMIKNSAPIEARNIQQAIDMDMIRESAPKQAAMLKTLNDYMDKQEKLEQATEEERKMIFAGAQEQARMLQRQYENDKMVEMIRESAPIEARNIQQAIDMDMIRESAPKQAAMLKTLNDYMDKQEKLEQATEEERKMILSGAREQAKMLQRQYERDLIRESSIEEAKRLVEENKKAIAEEQKQGEAIASQIVHENVEPKASVSHDNKEITWIDSRYATLGKFSKALRIHASQNDNLRKRMGQIYNNTVGVKSLARTA